MRRNFRRTKMLPIAALVLAMQCLALPGARGENAEKAARAEGSGASTGVPASLVDEIKALRSKAVQLESALAREHQGESESMRDSSKESNMDEGASQSEGMTGGGAMTGDTASGAGTTDAKDMAAMGKSKMSGMGKMGGKDMGAMGKSKMSGMDMMGRMPDRGGMSLPSSLPGFPGASHVYHIGGTGFFLDHPEHITLNVEQQAQLSRIKEEALLADATSERSIDEAEQQLWVLTSAGEPDIKRIESKIREIEKLRGGRRLAFIRAVGDAAKVLTDEQRGTLVGQYAPMENPPDASPAR